MKEYSIGTGGWAYFHVQGLHPLVAYSKAFDFVEVNSTFYEIPALRVVENWRRIVPADFQFAVRAPRALTHTYKFQPTREMLKTFGKARQICEILRADVLHLQTPASCEASTLAENLQALLKVADLGSLRLALETRDVEPSKLPAKLTGIMQENDMIHCVDLSKGQMPAYKSDILYTRLFGKAEHNIYQPSDEELSEVDEKASNANVEKVKMSFHFVRMYKDAARLKVYKKTGKFPQVTNSTGMTSLEQVLSEDADFPAPKKELVYKQGWKLFDLTKEQRVRASYLLQQLPERTYSSVTDVVRTLSSGRK